MLKQKVKRLKQNFSFTSQAVSSWAFFTRADESSHQLTGVTNLTTPPGFVDVCGATFSMEDLPGTPDSSEDDEAAGAANRDLLKVDMKEELVEALKKLCSPQQFTLPPSPVSNESESECPLAVQRLTGCRN